MWNVIVLIPDHCLSIYFMYYIIMLLKIKFTTCIIVPGPIAQSVARITQEPEVLGSIPGPTTYFCFSFR